MRVLLIPLICIDFPYNTHEVMSLSIYNPLFGNIYLKNIDIHLNNLHFIINFDLDTCRETFNFIWSSPI